MSSRHTITARPRRNLDVYKDLCKELVEQGQKSWTIAKQLQDQHGARVNASTIGRRLVEWGFVEPPPPTDTPKRIRNLDLYKQELLEWDGQGVTADDIAARLKEKYEAHVPTVTIRKALIHWHGPTRSNWRRIEACPPQQLLSIPPNPMDLHSEKEVGIFMEGIRLGYLEDSSQPNDKPADLTVQWSDILFAAACYNAEVQGVLVKESLQPGYHWSSDRLFNPLWVLGIHLPGSYTDKKVDDFDKIMGLVDSLTPSILAKVRVTILDLIEKSISVSVREEGEDYVRMAKGTFSAAHPPKSMISLLRVIRHEIDELQVDIGLRKSLKNLLMLSDFPACAALSQHLEEDLVAPSLLDGFTAKALKGLQSWQQAWMVPQDLPPLTASDLNSVERSNLPDSHRKTLKAQPE